MMAVATILLVEDNDLNRDMLARRLTRRGFTVVQATNGLEAVTLALRARPDLVLMDLSLPVLDGFDATRRLKQTAATASIPVLALTAHVSSADREQALAAGCADLDTKPVDLTRLLHKIEHLLGSMGSKDG